MSHLHRFKGFVLLSGFLLGFGISYSGMINPKKVLGFLDVLGDWDPTLLFVLGGAVGVTLITFRFVLRLHKPIFNPTFMLPTLTKADRPLVIGQTLFGIGWGLIGYCPGPVFAGLALGESEPVIVMLAMVAGGFLFKLLNDRTCKI